ncbi:hypothetical protein [Marinicella sp. W31]|uniref:hypothetical protein n=1 Tax=Marinicella sp. W31 TaxID=3023713 RepID=UPI003756C589
MSITNVLKGILFFSLSFLGVLEAKERTADLTSIVERYESVKEKINNLPSLSKLGSPASVGNDPSCDYNSIMTALMDGHVNINVVAGFQNGPIEWDGDMNLIGGFLNCGDASSGVISNDPSFSTISGGSTGPAIKIFTTSNINVNIHNFSIINGISNGSTPSAGLALLLTSGGNVTLSKVSFGSNEGNNGGAIFVSGGGVGTANLNIFDVKADALDSNRAINGGGFIFCREASVLITAFSIDGSSLSQISKGGAIHATENCSLTMISSPSNWTAMALDLVTSRQNTLTGKAKNLGGAIYAEKGAEINLFGQFPAVIGQSDNHPFVLTGNLAFGSNMKGGGIYAKNLGTVINAKGVSFLKSTIEGSAGLGGAVAIEDEASFVMGRLDGKCKSAAIGNVAKRSCNEFFNNFPQTIVPLDTNASATGSAIYARDKATVDVSRATFFSDKTSGYVIDAADAGTDVSLEGNSFIDTSSPIKGFIKIADFASATMKFNSFSVTPSSQLGNFVATLVSDEGTISTFASVFYSTNGTFEFANFEGLGTQISDDSFFCSVLDEIDSINGTNNGTLNQLMNQRLGRPIYPFYIGSDLSLRLLKSSNAVDICLEDIVLAEHNDIDNEVRGGYCFKPNQDCAGGVSMDAGADEIGDLIFKDTFE